MNLRQSFQTSSDRSHSSTSSSDATGPSQTRRSRRRDKTNTRRKSSRRLTMEGLERRQLLAANSLISIPGIDDYDGARNIGSVSSFRYQEKESPQLNGVNDFYQNAEFVPLGNGTGQRDTIDITGSVGFTQFGTQFISDIDYYSFDLKAGDILDIATLGAVTTFDVFLPSAFDSSQASGRFWFAQDDPFSSYPIDSPLQTLGNANAAQVVPFDGRYTIAVSAESGLSSYTIGLRTYRPVTESLPIGQGQIVFLDFDGGSFARDDFNAFLANPGIPTGGRFRIPDISQTLDDAGVVVSSINQYQQIADRIVSTVEQQFADIGVYGSNGSYSSTGNPGEYGITILNSFDHPDPGDNPLVTRVVFGSTNSFEDIAPALGLAQTLDVGNFDLSESVLVWLDEEVTASEAVETSAAFSLFDVLGLEIGATTTHELAHVFGLYHTDGTNLTPSLIDGGGALNEENGLGVGPDGILGTMDDIPVRFRTDFVDPGGVISFGTLYSADAISHTLATGTRGGSLTGRVFNDLNSDGVGTSDPGLSGVTVFADANNNGLLDATEANAVTGADGSYSLNVAAGTYTVIAMTPSNFTATTSTSQTVTTTTSGAVAPTFGFGQVNPDITGKKFADLNGNGALDAGEPGVEGAYIYADLDGDNRPDLGEPFDITDANGFYTLDLPILGRAYAIREVEEPGFIRTLPSNAEGEWVINYTGGPLGNNYHFGGLPSRDYGDAPDTYSTSIAAGGPSHGTLTGLTIGTQIDRESDGVPTADASGDDVVNTTTGQFDDEDGVVQTVALRPGATGIITVTLTNTTGSTGYLQAWLDLNADGDFLDAGEQLRTDAILGTGTHNINVTLPSTFDVNIDGTADGVLNTFSRFRYSLTPGLGVGGGADTGEVEDHPIRILAAGNNDDAATDDFVTVPQNAIAFPIDVLANDFSLPTNPLTITNLNVNGTKGIVSISGSAGNQVILYSPPSNFTGIDRFTYFLSDGSFAVVTASVQFATSAPIAVDDIFEVASNETSVPLNLLDNDIASVAGGLRITQVSRGTGGGILSIDPGSRGVRYTPLDGFVGTEQFSYSISDDSGQTSAQAVGTVVLTPQSLVDDKAEFKIEILDRNNDTELLTLQAGQTFRVRVSVDDISKADSEAIQGLQSAFIDLLYTSELVTPVDTNTTDAFPFDITFGPQFQTGAFQLGNALTPGLIDEVGSTQSFSDLDTIGSSNDLASFTGFAEVFTLTMQATGSGLAIFKTDPTNAAVSETTLITPTGPEVLDYDEIRYGSTQIEIAPLGDGFPVALDDSFPVGVDSLGATIRSSAVARFNVLTNDLIGANDIVTELTLKESALNGTVQRVDVGNDNNFANDYFSYTPKVGFAGFDRFSYILTVESPQFGTVRSIAEVTMTVGAVQNPLVNFDFTFVDEAGNAITSVPVGQRFGLRIDAIDLGTGRPPTEAVFAGFLDILYNTNFLSTIPVDNGGNPDLFDFDVEFDPQFLLDPAVGVNDRPGLIDEFGSNQGSLGGSGLTLATIYFRGTAAGTTTVTGGPADRFPFQDTLLDQNDDPVPIENIQYDAATITILGSGEPLQNTAMPADVNGDNLVTAIDALIVINEMSRREASGETASSSDRIYYHDVNGDGYVTAVDALQVINQLNTLTSPSGEAIAPAPVQQPVTQTDETTDRVIVDLSSDAKVISESGSDDTSVQSPVQSAAESTSGSDGDDDDLLSLLADDIANQWS
ncbi:Ig-like domain-containing protein [Aporhodopirellula aestuarii]|uniref:Ig-like domain-containing protein n=1 Tax=Aporhodopirellula aestuarii TaxID=2950107 RepID=A0ABT0U6M7_9BACT|nr:Ig-like domain-containing protein [Aporhodopirellula aestuarii]MCM2371981.1 Ig-like domain-containing protein [Aporhodopirellula aestuarii]